MRKESIIVFFVCFFLCFIAYPAYSQMEGGSNLLIKTVDVNKDGTPDITYYNDGKYVTKVEADTNYDNKPDIVVHVKNGKFESADVDTDYDGKPDIHFNDVTEFNKWLNKNRPGFVDYLNRPDWQVSLLKF